jgi:hypothetical protein
MRSLNLPVRSWATVCGSPTTPMSASSKICASGSLLIVTVVSTFYMRARCWIAPKLSLRLDQHVPVAADPHVRRPVEVTWCRLHSSA